MLSTLVLIFVLFLATALKRGSKSCNSRCQRDWNLCAVFCRVSTFLYLAQKELLPQLLGLWKSRGTSSQCLEEQRLKATDSVPQG